jgi:hypothetical protein
MKPIYVIAVISLFIFASCSRTVPCSNNYITPAFIGFKLTDLDTLVVREYKKDDNFITVLDTALIVNDTTYVKAVSTHDTTVIILNNISGQEKWLFPDHDWQIYIPAKNVTISMSKFVSPQTDMKCILGGDLCGSCSNPIESFMQNGQQIIPIEGKLPYSGGFFYFTYIHR